MTRRRKLFIALVLLVASSVACNDCTSLIALGSDAYCNAATAQ